MTLESRALLRQVLQDEQIACDYREPGHVQLAQHTERLERIRQVAGALHADGFAAELLDRQQTQQFVAAPLDAAIQGSLFTPANGVLHAAQFIYAVGHS